MQRSSCSPPRMRFRGFLSASALGLLSLAVAIPAAAQQGTITGRVVDQETGTPLSAVAVQVVGTLGAQVSGGATNAQGQFNLVVAPGNYAVVVSGIGYETSRRDAVRVVAGETVVLELTMRSRALALNPILVTPSFSQSTAVGAPASAFSIELEEVKARPTASPLDHLRTRTPPTAWCISSQSLPFATKRRP
jgi:5-hydroxyisourate hydrolase-like protein (transthyretin family)